MHHLCLIYHARWFVYTGHNNLPSLSSGPQLAPDPTSHLSNRAMETELPQIKYDLLIVCTLNLSCSAAQQQYNSEYPDDESEGTKTFFLICFHY